MATLFFFMGDFCDHQGYGLASFVWLLFQHYLRGISAKLDPILLPLEFEDTRRHYLIRVDGVAGVAARMRRVVTTVHQFEFLTLNPKEFKMAATPRIS